MKNFLITLTLMASSLLYAGVEVYSTPSMQKLFIEEAPSLGKGMFLVKFTGVESPWKDKVILTKKDATTSNHYQFEYKEELSSGIKTKTYTIVTKEGQALVNGSMVNKVKLWTPEHGRDGVSFVWDKELTVANQEIKLIDEHKKKAYVPEVD